MKDGISYGEHNPTGKCRECGGPNYGKYAVCQACIRKHPTPKAHDRSRLHAALDAVLDSAMARDREPSMDEEKAYDMGVVDAKKGRAQNLNPDWSRTLKSAYVSGYHAGLGHGRARDADGPSRAADYELPEPVKVNNAAGKVIGSVSKCGFDFIADFYANAGSLTANAQYKRFYKFEAAQRWILNCDAALQRSNARDAGVLTDDIEFDFSQNAKTGSGKMTPISVAKAIKTMERKYGPEVAAALRARHT